MSACGKGSYGRLGLGDSNNQSTPKKVCIDARIKKVSSSKGSDGHTLALSEHGQVYSWGDGNFSLVLVEKTIYYFSCVLFF